ncbi:MAG: hypothetical protein ACLQT5_01200 [Steroidobacteraceae bacterium]
MKKKQAKAPPDIGRPAPDEWQHFWDGEAPPLVEEVMRKRTQAKRVAKENAGKSRDARQRPERDEQIRKLRAQGKSTHVIGKNADVIKLNGGKSLSRYSINRIAPPKK